MDKQYYELCIPRVSVETTKEYMYQCFCKVNWGKIIRIHEIPLKVNPKFKRVIIRILWRLEDENIKKIYERVFIANEPIYIVYDMPFYWKLVKNQAPKKMPPPAFIKMPTSTVAEVEPK